MGYIDVEADAILTTAAAVDYAAKGRQAQRSVRKLWSHTGVAKI